jgi:hypothetical protein
MNPVSEERMRLRIEYSRETDLIFSDNISAYADWLEKRLALHQPPFVEPSEQLFCECERNNPYTGQSFDFALRCFVCNKVIKQNNYH